MRLIKIVGYVLSMTIIAAGSSVYPVTITMKNTSDREVTIVVFAKPCTMPNCFGTHYIFPLLPNEEQKKDIRSDCVGNAMLWMCKDCVKSKGNSITFKEFPNTGFAPAKPDTTIWLPICDDVKLTVRRDPGYGWELSADPVISYWKHFKNLIGKGKGEKLRAIAWSISGRTGDTHTSYNYY